MSVTITLSEDEQALLEHYAKIKAVSVEQALRSAVLELIEDEIDLIAAEQANIELQLDPITYPHGEAWAEIMKD